MSGHGSIEWVCRLWATQAREEAYSRRRDFNRHGDPHPHPHAVFFEGTRLYSFGHHYLLGELETTPAGTIVAKINTTGYAHTRYTRNGDWQMRDSPSTSNHRRHAAAAAAKAGHVVVECPDIHFDVPEFLTERLRDATDAAQQAVQQAAMDGSYWPHFYLADAVSNLSRAVAVAEAYRTPFEPPADMVRELIGLAVRLKLAGWPVSATAIDILSMFASMQTRRAA